MHTSLSAIEKHNGVRSGVVSKETYQMTLSVDATLSLNNTLHFDSYNATRFTQCEMRRS
jgi:hypothetical protein